MQPAVGVVHPYWSFWQEAGGPDFRDGRRVLAAASERVLEQHADLVWSLDVEADVEPQPPTGEVDAVVVVVSIASPPMAVLTVLSAHPRAAVVLWAVSDGAPVGPDFSHRDITRRGGTVGVPMIGAALRRLGRTFDIVVTDPAAPASREVVARAVRCAAAAGRIRRARLGVVGVPLPGYAFTSVPAAALALVGVQTVSVDEESLSSRVLEVLAAAGNPPDAEGRAAAWCTVLDGVVDGHRLTAGTLNCHAAALRRHPGIATAPCLALGESTSRGVPWTCTGDVATAFAMLVVASLGAPTLYHEIEAVDEATDSVLLANSGEHDARFAVTGAGSAVNPWFPGPPDTLIRIGEITAGPASLVAARTDGDRITLVVAEGEFTGRRYPATGTMNAGFRFDQGPVSQAWRRWAMAGVGHHSCATDRRLASEIAVMGLHLGVRVEVI